MVRGSCTEKGQLVNNNVLMKPKKKKFRASLSHSNRNNSRTYSSNSVSFSASEKSKFSPGLTVQNSIFNYVVIQKNEKVSGNSSVLITTASNSNGKQKDLVTENCICINSEKFDERIEDYRIREKCSVSDEETNKTESCVPFSPSTALSRLNLGPKKISKVKKCLIPSFQKLNAKVLKDNQNSPNPQSKLTEFFPVRRSIRKTGKTVLEEKRKTLVEAVLSNREDGLEVRIFEGKGRGVVSTKKFCKGEFVVEYAGELISMEEAQKREAVYARNENIGCYMYYFKHRNQQHCIDATAETKRLGRLLNHSRYGNLSTKTVEINGVPRLILVAKEDIEPDFELTYDYGDRSRVSLQYHPWLAN